MASKAHAKALGVYYTDPRVAEFLVAWAIRSGTETILDPSFGGGVFLRAALDRIGELGIWRDEQVIGIDLDDTAHAKVEDELRPDGAKNPVLHRRNFFEVEPGEFTVDAVVGNPPFIRYQTFSGQARKLALKRAASQGVCLSELASAWAPFLIHSISMIKLGGRLAMVLPLEAAHATYARPVLEHISRIFGDITLLTFREKMFDHLNENTILILAENKGAKSTRFILRDMMSVKDLTAPSSGKHDATTTSVPISADSIFNGQERLVEYLLPSEIRALYAHLRGDRTVRRLGELADVGIGYVTGANSYFHLTRDDAHLWSVPPEMLKQAVCHGRALAGLDFTHNDWERGLEQRDTAYLLHIDTRPELPDGVKRYLENGMQLGIPSKYKCRCRSPWYRIPHVRCPDAFLTYMSGSAPRLALNTARAVGPNCLHMVRTKSRFRDLTPHLSVLWNNSLTLLSCEIEGHTLGGGLLKLEPGEARNVLLPSTAECVAASANVLPEADTLLRSGQWRESRLRSDEYILKKGLGLTERECNLIRDGVAILMSRRQHNGRGIADAA